jgi:hypothetical protein|tara:strand:- start:4385 stop:4981 length:597 start_codon:yes stop_codon:yes gene_type:complete
MVIRPLIIILSLFSLSACVATTEQYVAGINSVSSVVESSIETGRQALGNALNNTKKKNVKTEETIDLGNPTISDEQNFEAVSERETIESDAERRKQQSAKYILVKPVAIPDRPKMRYLTPVQFAVKTTHPVGKRRYNRLTVNMGNVTKPCLRYQSEELAQYAFLRSGGPNIDSRGVDPDGDGYACGWDPSVYRNLKKN